MHTDATLREYAAIHAPITLRDVVVVLPDFDMARASDRRSAIAVLARMHVEYADALIRELDGNDSTGA